MQGLSAGTYDLSFLIIGGGAVEHVNDVTVTAGGSLNLGVLAFTPPGRSLTRSGGADAGKAASEYPLKGGGDDPWGNGGWTPPGHPELPWDASFVDTRTALAGWRGEQFLLPVPLCNYLYGTHVAQLWIEFLRKTQEVIFPLHYFGDGSDIVEGTYGIFGTGFRNGKVTLRNLETIRLTIKTNLIKRLAKDQTRLSYNRPTGVRLIRGRADHLHRARPDSGQRRTPSLFPAKRPH